jgi:DNA-binding winged helix-turn-helix (wHTH) protein
MHLGPYTLDPLRHVLVSGQAEVQLSPLGARFLGLLGDAPGTVVERGTLIDALWRGDWVVGDPALNRLVSEVRRAVGDDPRKPKLIQTVPRRGYQLVATNGAALEAAPEEPALAGEAPGDAVPVTVTPAPMPRWREVWSMVNATLIILACGISSVLLSAALAHN